MVYSLQTSNQTQLQNAQRFTPSLIQDFVAFVDGSQRTTQNYVNNLKQFAVWTRYKKVDQPIRQDIINYRDWLASEHQAIEYSHSPAGWQYRLDQNGDPVILTCKPATIKLYLQSVKQFFKWTSANNLYPNIAEQIRPPKVRMDIHKRDALTPAEVLKVEKSIEAKAEERTAQQAAQAKDPVGRTQRSTEQGKRLYAMYLLAVNAGLRTIEISRAKIKDLETINGQACIYIWGKGHSEPDQKKPLAPEVYNAIVDYLKSRTDNPTKNSALFAATGNRSHGRRIAPTTISKMLKSALVSAGFNSERLTAHSLRHTAGTAVQSISNNIYATQQYMRHLNPATTEIYLHVENDKQNATLANKLFALYHPAAAAADPNPAAATAAAEEAAASPSEQAAAAETIKNIFEGLTEEQRKALVEYAKRAPKI